MFVEPKFKDAIKNSIQTEPCDSGIRNRAKWVKEEVADGRENLGSKKRTLTIAGCHADMLNPKPLLGRLLTLESRVARLIGLCRCSPTHFF